MQLAINFILLFMFTLLALTLLTYCIRRVKNDADKKRNPKV